MMLEKFILMDLPLPSVPSLSVDRETFMLDEVGDRLFRQRAERRKKHQAAIRRLTERIMAARRDGMDGVIILFEAGKFPPGKEFPFPLAELKALIRRCCYRARVPCSIHMVKARNTSCMCIGCGTKYPKECARDIRECT